ncbi:hypothetical protein [Rheinheimera sp.]|uniref:hypothetical protein n=1 Tax=Rheinheimera sp. TaxID=1869214 RepID=UPI0027B95CCF|nr:hypothetical protein [Rheinheimera sp.]
MQKLFKSSHNAAGRLLVALCLYQAAPVIASETWHWHGYIAQGLMRSAESNFVNNDGAISAELTEFGLNSTWQLSNTLRLAGQLMYLDGGNRFQQGGRIDYLFLNWTAISELDWQLELYAGRYKNMHWLYSATRDVAITRPLIVLPQSVYFDAFRDIAVGSDGVALKSTHNLSWGELELNWSLGATPIPKEQSQRVISTLINGKTEQDFVHQLSAFLRPEQSKSQWGLSLLDSDFNYRRVAEDIFADGDFTVQRVMLNWRYSEQDWELSSELFQERVSVYGFYAPGTERTQFGWGAYVLGRYNVSPQSTLYLSHDHFFANKDDKRGHLLPLQSGGMIPSYFGYQRDTALGVSYDIQHNLRLKMEYHWNTGTGRLGPNVVPDIVVNRSRHNQLWAMQLMYWF